MWNFFNKHNRQENLFNSKGPFNCKNSLSFIFIYTVSVSTVNLGLFSNGKRKKKKKVGNSMFDYTILFVRVKSKGIRETSSSVYIREYPSKPTFKNSFPFFIRYTFGT